MVVLFFAKVLGPNLCIFTPNILQQKNVPPNIFTATIFFHQYYDSFTPKIFLSYINIFRPILIYTKIFPFVYTIYFYSKNKIFYTKYNQIFLHQNFQTNFILNQNLCNFYTNILLFLHQNFCFVYIKNFLTNFILHKNLCIFTPKSIFPPIICLFYTKNIAFLHQYFQTNFI